MARGAGALDRRITIERAYSSSTNSFNEAVETWFDHACVWAERKDVSDSEKVAAAQVGSALMSRFVVRSSEKTRAVTPKDRISHDNDTWNIHGIKETTDGRKRFLEITAIKSLE